MGRMSSCFDAGDEFAIAATHAVGPPGTSRGASMATGRMKAHLMVWEPEDDEHPTLPTLGEFLHRHMDERTRLLTYPFDGYSLVMDAAPLLELPARYLAYRVSPGASFVTDEALELSRGAGPPG
jgi:hypothetical protein